MNPLPRQAMSNFDGFAILPRFATEVYFNCTTVAQNVQMYNNLYSGAAPL